uniref:Uncharacterized protein n=1 Tax=Oryza glaberrima TaxID=4538 RepID=I1PIQ1_ORYGL
MGRRGDARGARGLRRRRAQGEEEAPATRARRGGGDGDARDVEEKLRRRSIWTRRVRRVRLHSVSVSFSARLGV